MLIYGESGIFAHKKSMKQFLQPMIEQVWGGCAIFLSLFFRATVLMCRFFFFNSTLLFGVDLHIFGCILCVFHQKVKQCLGTKFSLFAIDS